MAGRCAWPASDPLMIKYHDEEWGLPVFDDQKLFEILILDIFQAGLNWRMILNKREHFRQAFAGFDPAKVAGFGLAGIERLMNDPTIIRNKAKIIAAVENARLFIDIQKESGSFSQYIWGFTGGKTIQNNWTELVQIPARTELSDRISNDMKKRGFKFAGSTILYAVMQTIGMVNDHTIDCFRYREIKEMNR
jgi:DNA-3-methyladenine glycosylase I